MIAAVARSGDRMIAMLAERRCKVNVRWDEAMWNGREVLGRVASHATPANTA
jgi:hypothetical protein